MALWLWFVIGILAVVIATVLVIIIRGEIGYRRAARSRATAANPVSGVPPEPKE